MAKGRINTKRIISNEGMLQNCTKGLARVESACTFKLGLSLLMLSFSKTKQSNFDIS